MTGPTDGLRTAPVSADFVADVLGVEDKERARLAARLVPALQKIDPELVPGSIDHPYAEAIANGVGGLDGLFAEFRSQKSEARRVEVLEAVCLVLEAEHAMKSTVIALEKIMAGTKSPAILSMAARALATAQHPPFLEQQRQFLAAESPAERRRSIRLLGYGRYAPAVEPLLALMRPDQMALLDVLVWALGEIGDERAVPPLHALIERFVLTEAGLDALGKIGARVSVMRALPFLLEGTEGQRAAAARCLGRIADRHDGDLGDKGLARTVREALEKLVDADPSPRVRFPALVAFARLDGHLEPNRIMAALGGGLGADELDGVSKLLGPKPSGKKGPRRGRKPII